MDNNTGIEKTVAQATAKEIGKVHVCISDVAEYKPSEGYVEWVTHLEEQYEDLVVTKICQGDTGKVVYEKEVDYGPFGFWIQKEGTDEAMSIEVGEDLELHFTQYGEECIARVLVTDMRVFPE